MMLEDNFLKDIYKRLSLFKRYRDTPVVEQESIAEHSYFVVLITDTLCKVMKLGDIDRLKALEMAIYHDISESFSDDYTYEMKYISGTEGFRKALDIVEDSILESISNKMKANNISQITKEYKDRKGLSAKIVKLADWYSVYFYCSMENERGDNGKILEIKERSKTNIDRMELTLNEPR